MGLGRNEAEVRYAICDPLMSMVCDCYSNTLKLEETVKNNLEMREVEDDDEKEEAVLVSLRTLWAEDKDQSAPPPPPPSSSEGTVEEAGAGAEKGRRSVGGVVSADYAVYMLGRPGQTKVVAIIDAKKRITPHSVAQVIGYYSAFRSW